jgi:hypothetical protein
MSPAYGFNGFRFFRFEKFWLWGGWKDSPLVHESNTFKYMTDIAICKIPEMPNDAAHQPFSLSSNPFAVGESAYAIVRGVVSRSFSGEEHAYGAMLDPAMNLPLDEPGVVDRTLRTLIGSKRDGFAQVFGAGL